MPPSRKRLRTRTPKVEVEVQEAPTQADADAGSGVVVGGLGNASSSSVATSSNASGLQRTDPALRSNKADTIITRQLKSKGSWYGTWPRKAIASTQIARESILADKSSNSPSATPSTVDLSRYEPPRRDSIRDGRPPSMYLGKSRETSDVTMGGTLEADKKADDDAKKDANAQKDTDTKAQRPATALDASEPDSTKDKDESASIKNLPKPDIIERPVTSSGWFGGWLGGSEVPTTNIALDGAASSAPAVRPVAAPETQKKPDIPAPTPTPIAPGTTTVPATPVPPASSWFGLWSTAAPSTVSEGPNDLVPAKLSNETDTVMEDAPLLEDDNVSPAPVPISGSGWAFWSNDTPKKSNTPGKDGKSKSKDSGKVAVIGEASQTSPEPAKAVNPKKTKSSKRSRPISIEGEELARKAIQLDLTPAKNASSQSLPALPPNLITPTVKNTYKLVENPSILQQIARLLLHGQQKPVKHVFTTKEAPRIKKALAIGIHGLFPAPLLRTMIGQPTGTSIRFANHAAAAIRRWGDAHGCADLEVEKVALEGEGKIAERVDNLWKLLLNWIDGVRKADFIMIACHSQGVPVAIMLVAKLIEFGVVSNGRIGVCAMAGVSLGPFPDYKSKYIGGSAGELFEFANSESVISKRYEESLRIALKYGVRITYCASIDDQLVSMESAIFSPASHPYIYRMVFVDGRTNAPNFITHLIGFALKLRNLGVSDHGLIRELSAPLAGSLYGGEGHSRLYDDEKVYDFAIEFTLETTSVGDVPLDIKKYEIPTNINPYVLPWIMRGLLEEDFVKTELDAEVTELLKQFDEWKPVTKVLKDVKYRLEAVRSKL